MPIPPSIGGDRPGRLPVRHRPGYPAFGLVARLLAAPILTVPILGALALIGSGPARAQYAAGTGASATGAGATAVGENSRADGTAATAVGRDALAIGPYSFAQGSNAFAGRAGTSTGGTAGGIAIGYNAVAGDAFFGSNIAIGSYATATSPNSAGDNIAFGNQASATGLDSMAIGGQTTASGRNSIAIGNNSTESAADNATVLGVAAKATGAAAGSVVLGANARSSTAGGVALGFESVALRGALNGTEAFSGTAVSGTLGAVSVGNATNLRQVTNLAGGTQDTDAVNLRQLRGAGNALAGALGGGAVFAQDGTLTAPRYSVQGQVLNTVGGAISNLDTAITTLNTDGSRYFAVRTTGPAAQAVGTDSVAMGAGASALNLRGVALGSGSVADRAGLAGAAEAFSGTRVASTAGAVSVGTIGSERQITNLAGGTQDTDAVNLRQLRGTGNALAGALGGGAVFAADGTLTAPKYTVQGQVLNTVGGAISTLDAAITTLNTVGSRYFAVRTTGPAAQAVGTDSVAMGAGASALNLRGVALGTGSVADRAGLGGGAEAFSGTRVASTAGAVSVGTIGSERQITNLAGGTQNTDAVNLRQLRGTGNALAGALGGGAGFDQDGRFTGPSYAVGGRSYGSVGGAITALDSTGVKYDVDASTGGRANSVTLAGGDPNQPVLLRRVAAGVAATDAANLGQVTAQVAKARGESFAYTDQQVAAGYGQAVRYTDQRVAVLDRRMDGVGQQVGQFGQQIGRIEQQVGQLDRRVGSLEERVVGLGSAVSGLSREVGNAKLEARRAAAVGLAAASLRFDDRPGKLSLAAGGGVWRGEGAGAFGLGYTLPDGSARLNATGATTGRDFGFGAGASFTLD
ncbi:YadA-like family protein [Methylobacterium planeticum]|uniref:Calcium-binding protein n=1 Tax=Methylobacterium planeticum TaxID=2615211 RepID=A0A6N6MFE0_9HYPH|nr:YadA-like family protein [Methylobacterium planeticum]KAB1069517.1 hypothetical protein F6X51_25160 [Methylobacterium planeticum]